MKKIFLMLALFSAVLSSSAQIATENSKLFDNVGMGVTVGASAPMDLNSVFPLNTNIGVKITKEFTPVFGLQIEALGFLNDNHFADLKTAFKATNLGVNSTINLSNLFGGYLGSPRKFEVSMVGGLGWMRQWETWHNSLTAKTGIDFSFNLGKKKAHSFVITPAAYWNLNKFNKIQFNRLGSQIALNVSYVYHFETSNGTHHFKLWDIGELNKEIAYLQGALDECNSREPKVVEKTVTVATNTEWFVQFAQKSAELTEEAKTVLNNIGNDLVVDVVGTASPEGETEFNQRLSEKRAAVVADYLTNRGVKVNSWVGKGVQIGESTNRLAIITVAQ